MGYSKIIDPNLIFECLKITYPHELKKNEDMAQDSEEEDIIRIIKDSRSDYKVKDEKIGIQ